MKYNSVFTFRRYALSTVSKPSNIPRMSSDENYDQTESSGDSPHIEDEEYDEKWEKFMNRHKASLESKDARPVPPLDILFPDDLENLRTELKVLKDEKAALSKRLDSTVEKYELLKIELDANNKFRNPVTGAQLATSKIVELSKKLRELTAELGASKLQCKQLEKVIKQFSVMHESKSSGGSGEATGDGCCGDTATFDEQKKLKKQLEASQLKLFRTRSDGERLKSQLEFAYKVIEKEVGKDAESVLKDFKDDNQSWIGRAEQIATLREKVAELTEKIDTRKSCFMMNRNKVDSLKAREKELKTEHQKEVQDLKNQIEEIRKSNVGAKARYHVLECELKDERNKIKILTEKSNTDDEMVDILKKKVKTNTTEKVKEKELNKTLDNQLASAREELDQTKVKYEQLIRALGERDARIREQEEKLRTLDIADGGNTCIPGNGKLADSFPVRYSGDSHVINRLPTVEEEKESLISEMESNRNKMNEMRVALAEAEESWKSEMDRCSKLEKKIASLENNNNNNKPRFSKSRVGKTW